jgi:hypothetical protein
MTMSMVREIIHMLQGRKRHIGSKDIPTLLGDFWKDVERIGE